MNETKKEFNYEEKLKMFMLAGVDIAISFSGLCFLLQIFQASSEKNFSMGLSRLESQNEKFFFLHDRVKSELYSELAEIKAAINDVKIRTVAPPSPPVTVQQTNTPAAAPAPEDPTKRQPGGK